MCGLGEIPSYLKQARKCAMNKKVHIIDTALLVGAVVFPLLCGIVFPIIEDSAKIALSRNVVSDISFGVAVTGSLFILGVAVSRVFLCLWKKIKPTFCFVTVVVALLCLPFLPLGFLLYLPGVFLEISRNQDALLHRTDHRKIAEACVVLLVNANGYDSLRVDDHLLPAPIKDLRLSSIRVTEHEVRLKYGGGHLGSYGFVFRREGDGTGTLRFFRNEDSMQLVSHVPISVRTSEGQPPRQ